LSRILYDNRGHTTISGLHPLSHFSALPVVVGILCG
jgi:hypothetical protein